MWFAREARMGTHNPQTLKIVSFPLKLFAVLPLLIGLGLLAGAGFAVHHQYTILKKLAVR